MNRKPKWYHIGDEPKPVAKPDPRDPKIKILGISLCSVVMTHEGSNLFLSSLKPSQNEKGGSVCWNAPKVPDFFSSRQLIKKNKNKKRVFVGHPNKSLALIIFSGL